MRYIDILKDCTVLREDRQALRPYIAVGVIRSGDASVTALWIE